MRLAAVSIRSTKVATNQARRSLPEHPWGQSKSVAASAASAVELLLLVLLMVAAVAAALDKS